MESNNQDNLLQGFFESLLETEDEKTLLRKVLGEGDEESIIESLIGFEASKEEELEKND